MLRLYRPRTRPGFLVGEDRSGGLNLFPAEAGGWAKRTPWTGAAKQLEEVSMAEARGTRWPGAVGGVPRAGKPARHQLAVRVTDEERAAWDAARGEKQMAEWMRDACNEAAARKAGK